MYKNRVLEAIFPQIRSTKTLTQLIKVETEIAKSQSIKPEPIRRLAAITKVDDQDLNDIGESLALSNHEKDQFINIVRSRPAIQKKMSAGEIMASAYKYGSEAIIDATLINWATQKVNQENELDKEELNWREIISTAIGLKNNPPLLPIKGQDVIDLGVVPGPNVSNLMLEVERWWLDNGCSVGRIECLKKLKSLLNN